MIPSPFHGIFSSLTGEDQESETLSSGKIQKTYESSSEKSAQPTGSGRAQGVGQVALDIFEYDSYYIIKAPIAGVRMSDLDIEINDTVLTIRGVRKQTDAIPDAKYYLKECFWGAFERSVTLPCSIDPKKVRATFNKESILKIIVPKEEKVKIIRISE